MKTSLALLGLAAALMASSCATVQQNVDARTYLAKCRYEYEGQKVTGVLFSTGTVIDAVDLDVGVKITDTTDRYVALDHVDASFFLDKNRVLDLTHKNFVRIAPGAASIETVSARIPFAGVLKSLGHRPETLGIKAKLWVTLLVGKATWETPIVVPLEVEVPIPYDEIDAFVAQREKQLADQAASRAESAARNAMPSVPVPHL